MDFVRLVLSNVVVSRSDGCIVLYNAFVVFRMLSEMLFGSVENLVL